ncbi:glycosyltransferase [Thermosynechococcus sp. NK55a]|uniref:glycosyltransferase n=1 Tax=Thermosynechococcus sp. NK55a TaxID=1394889 RepID=UPI00138AD493|nr:cellulose synthase catalytic subunit [Thermosynechococcus sp. NK55a]
MSSLSNGWFRFRYITIQFIEAPPMPPVTPWLAVEHLDKPWIFWPLFLMVVLSSVVLRWGNVQQQWARVIVVGSLIALMLHYLLWRSLATLNLRTPLEAALSLLLLGIEGFMMAGYGLQLYLLLHIKNRRPEADAAALAVKSGHYQPWVDIFIPTYNEPLPILRRTIVGCQALEYPHKRIYVLDDTRRPALRELACELGCEYLSRPDNRHAKAGNLNHALAQTQGELIAVFDADFVPTRNFLTRTVGFFQAPDIGLVQTYQSFYNPDPIARNLGLEAHLPQEVEIFSRHYQVLRDGIETALCYGSSFVVRRSALEAIGGFVTASLSEDYYTGIQLAADGYRLIYLNESLSAGLCAEDMAAHIRQRQRWARGTLQGFFIAANPLRVANLTWLQRLAHLEGMTQWFHSPLRLFLLLLPLMAAFWGIVPLETTLRQWLYYFMPYYWLLLSTFRWLNGQSRSAVVSDLYAVVQCVPLTLTVIQTLLRPFGHRFWVTPKGRHGDRYHFQWHLGAPLLVLFVLSVMAAVLNWQALHTKGLLLAWVWNLYNLLILALALYSLIERPHPDPYDWLNVQQTVELHLAWDQTTALWGRTIRLCEGGALVHLHQPLPPSAMGVPLTCRLLEAGIDLSGQIVNMPSPTTLKIGFDPLTPAQYRQLITFLFCEPNRWQWQQAPSELQTLWLLLRALVSPPLSCQGQHRHPAPQAKQHQGIVPVAIAKQNRGRGNH